MTDKTIEMAREAKAHLYCSPSNPYKLVDILFTPETLKTFEALIRADERKKFFTAEEADIALYCTDFSYHQSVTQTMVDKLEAIRNRKD
jgi:hypothetical protein